MSQPAAGVVNEAVISDVEDVVVDADDVALTAAHSHGNQQRGWSRRTWLGLVLLVVVGAAVGVAFTVIATRRIQAQLPIPDHFSAQFSSQGVSHPEFEYTGRVQKRPGTDGNWVLEAVISSTDPYTNIRTVVTIVNDHAYFQDYNAAGELIKTGCFDRERVPPIDDLDEVFADAVKVPEGQEVPEHVVQECASESGTMYAMTWGVNTGSRVTNTYYYCAKPDGSHKLVGSDFVATMWDLSVTSTSLVDVTVPKDMATGEPLQCEPLRHDISAVGGRYQASRRRLGLPDHRAPTKRKLPGATVKCYFIHGSGPSTDSDTTSTYTSYWGDVHNYLGNQCDQVKFMHRDYVSHAWDAPEVADDFCDETKSGHGSTVKDRILFTHGFGSLVVANAFYSGECSIASSTKWYALGSPWFGAKAADGASTVCQSQYGSIVGNAAAAIGFCSGTSVSNAMNSMKTTYTNTQFSAVAADARAHVDGQMCAWSSGGLNQGDGQQLPTVTSLAQMQGWHDGFTGTNECKNLNGGTDNFKLNKGFSGNIALDFYAPAINYLDLTCRYGDPWFDVLKGMSACSWFNEMTS